jgi:polysaccharide biosynthesis/export protein
MSFISLAKAGALALGASCLALPVLAVPAEPVPAESGAIAPSSTRSASNSVPDSSYVLGIGDQLDVNVFAYEEFTGQRTVLPDGTIIMPMIGHVPTAGKTTQQLVQEITTRLRTLLVNPVVTVNLTSLRPVVVNVAGEVQRPGTIQLREAAANANGDTNEQQPQQRPTLANALVAAGGITANANIRQIQVKRYSPNGSAEPIVINLWDAIQSSNAPPSMVLQDGDTVFVPTLQAGEAVDRRLLARSQFSPATVRVRVVGEVTAPGEVQVPPNSSISSAVAIAGGPTEDANLRRVGFIRLNDAGQVEQQELDLRQLSDTYQIQEGDVVVVPKRGSASFVDFAGRLFSPLGVLLNLF